MTKTKMKIDVAHQVPGRVRMKVPEAKGNPALLQQIADTFAAIPGIEQVTVNPATGSVVMHYDVERHDEFHGYFRDHVQAAGHHAPSTEIDDFAHKIEEEAEFLARHSQTARAVVDFFKTADREIRRATDNNVDLKILLAAGIITITVLEVAAAATPVWVTLTLFALNHVIEMHSRHDDGGPAVAPVVVKA